MDENAVVESTCEILISSGCQIVRKCSTTQRGIDIVALRESSGEEFFIEAKGGTSSRAGSFRYGKPYTQSQVFDRVAKGVFTCIELRAKHSNRSKQHIILAVPDERWFHFYLKPALLQLEAAGLKVWFISQ